MKHLPSANIKRKPAVPEDHSLRSHEANRTFEVRFVEKSTSEEVLFSGWDGWIRTSECGSQSPVPYRLATPQNIVILKYAKPWLCVLLFKWGG